MIDTRQATWWDVSAELVRGICIKVCVFGAITGATYAIDYNGLRGTANSPANTSEPVAVNSSNPQNNDSEDKLAALMQHIPVAQPIESQKSPEPLKPLAKPVGSAKPVARRVKPTKAGSAVVMPDAAERFDLCATACETRDPLVVRSSEIIQPVPTYAPPVGEPEAASFSRSVLRGGWNILGQAVDASGATLKMGKRALYSTVEAVW